MSNATANLFWTGGWDSTYRLLDLVLVQEREVQPYYLIDTSGLRPSFALEIETMRRLRDELKSDLIAPTIFRDIGDIAENRSITEKYERLLARSYLGPQYDWLARFAEQERIEGLELTIHRDDRAHAFLARHVEVAGDAHVLRAGSTPDLSIFATYRFPLFQMSKIEMQTEAERHGFRDLLERTWFCRTPTPRGEPCGVCGPCRYARDEGMGRRIPLRGQARYHKSRFKSRLRRSPIGEPVSAFLNFWRRLASK